MKRDLERWHRALARAAGELSLMIARGAARRSAVKRLAAEVLRAAEEMEKV